MAPPATEDRAALGDRQRALVVLAPIEPRTTGNGLAMRVGAICQAAALLYDVVVAVVPFAGVTAPVGRMPELRVTVVDPPRPADGGGSGSAEALGGRLAEVLQPTSGTPVLAIRSYLALPALALGDAVGSRWVAADLDDDDEAFFEASGDHVGAAYFNRLLNDIAPRLSALSAASSQEAAAMSGRYGVEVVTVANSVAVPPVRPSRAADRPTVLFVGNLTYQPNIEAACRLISDVLPALRREQGPQVEVTVVGSYHPAGPLGAYMGTEGVTLSGFAEELGGHYRRAAVVVAPIAVAGGTRIKVLEAFAAGVPVVTTPAGAAGLEVTHGEQVLIGDSPYELARLAGRVLSSRSLGESLASSAFSLVAQRYSPEASYSQVAKLLARAERTCRPGS